MKIRVPIFWQVFLHGFMLLVALAVCFALVDPFFRVERWRALHIRLATHLAHEVAIARDDAGEMQRLLDHHADGVGLRLTAYSLDGTLVASTVQPPLPALTEEELDAVAEGAFCNSKTKWHVASAIGDGRGRAAYLLLEDSLFPEPTDAGIWAHLIGAIVTLTLASVPLAWMISRPMRRLAATAEALGRGNLKVRSGIRRPDEVGVLATSLDEMADRLEALVKRERQLLADIGHELRTPLARIRVAAEFAREGDLERARKYLGEIGVDIDELDRLIEDVLAASRLELTEGPPLRKELLDPRGLLASAADRCRSRHPGRILDVDTTTNGARIDADPVLLRRAIDNLLDNAIKYSAAPESVRLEAREDAGKLSVSVSDRGIGIDAADLPRLFTPFFRTDRSRARSSGGVGLGLVLARRIAEAHGGAIAVTSRPGEGTTVGIRLPLAAQD